MINNREYMPYGGQPSDYPAFIIFLKSLFRMSISVWRSSRPVFKLSSITSCVSLLGCALSLLLYFWTCWLISSLTEGTLRSLWISDVSSICPEYHVREPLQYLIVLIACCPHCWKAPRTSGLLLGLFYRVRRYFPETLVTFDRVILHSSWKITVLA